MFVRPTAARWPSGRLLDLEEPAGIEYARVSRSASPLELRLAKLGDCRVQNRYFGDVGDFGKYGLLRRITGVSAADAGEMLSLGVVWYLVDDQSHNKDGKHTSYLNKPWGYRDCDPVLFDGLKSLLDEPGPRAVRKIERSGLELLPRDTRYVNEPLARKVRSEWLDRAIEKVRDCDVVFLDPDVGFQPPSVPASRKDAVKYVLWNEAAQFAESHRRQTLVFYHHLNRTKPTLDQIDEKNSRDWFENRRR